LAVELVFDLVYLYLA